LDEDLREELISSFQRDGRLRIVYDDPDSQIEGEILEYSSEVYGYDLEQNIEEYMVTITFKLTFTDLLRNEIIWENKSLTMMERFYPQAPEDLQITTEELAQKAIFEDLFSMIISNTLEDW